MREEFVALTCASIAAGVFGYCASAGSADAASFVPHALKGEAAVVQVHHRRYWYPGYYPYYPYPVYAPYYYGPPAVAYPSPVVYYPGPRYYPGPAVYGPYGGIVVRRPYDSYYADW
jgi:hypothetical protein